MGWALVLVVASVAVHGPMVAPVQALPLADGGPVMPAGPGPSPSRAPRSVSWLAAVRPTGRSSGAAPAGLARLPPDAIGAHRWPVPGAVVDTFHAGANPYGPGHRGVDLAAQPGTAVRAMADGTVAFAGIVAGRGWISLDHPDGLRTTVGPVGTSMVHAGDVVARSQVVGTAAGTAHADDARPLTDRLHVSARVHGTYLDPTPLVGRLVATLLPAPR